MIIHIIRDGRDVALSLETIGWMGAFPWQAKHSRLIAGLYWERTVRKGRQYGQMIAPDYTEVCFEELFLDPDKALAKLGEFIKEDLKYDKIYEVAIGAVRPPIVIRE